MTVLCYQYSNLTLMAFGVPEGHDHPHRICYHQIWMWQPCTKVLLIQEEDSVIIDVFLVDQQMTFVLAFLYENLEESLLFFLMKLTSLNRVQSLKRKRENRKKGIIPNCFFFSKTESSLSLKQVLYKQYYSSEGIKKNSIKAML